MDWNLLLSLGIDMGTDLVCMDWDLLLTDS